MLSQSVVKTIGVNGQISLGKQYAGQQVLVGEPEQGVWLIRTVDVIPHKARLDAALTWAAENEVSDANADAILEQLAGDGHGR